MQAQLNSMIKTYSNSINQKLVTPKLAISAAVFAKVGSVRTERMSVRVYADQQGSMDAVNPQGQPQKLGQGQPMPPLPGPVGEWLSQNCHDLVALFKAEYPSKISVNRQDVAVNAAIQQFLTKAGADLVQIPTFSSALAGRFMASRIMTHPKGSEGSRPSETSGPLAQSAYHTIAGLGEIICQAGDEWPVALAEHFVRVGENNL